MSTVVIILLWVFVGIVAMILASLIALGYALSSYANGIMTEMPWLQWFSYEDLRAKGYSSVFLNSLALDVLHEKSQLEYRLKAGVRLRKADQALFDEHGVLYFVVIEHLEFRLVKRGERKRRKFILPKLFLHHAPA